MDRNSESIISDSIECSIVQGPGTEIVNPQINFTQTQCFYCGQASKWIPGLAPAFPNFYGNQDTYSNYLDTVVRLPNPNPLLQIYSKLQVSMVCDVYGSDDPDCDPTTRYVANTVYKNWVGDGKSVPEVVKKTVEWVDKIAFPLCEAYEESPWCLALDVLKTAIFGCVDANIISYLCPSPETPCDVCTKYFHCPSHKYC